MPNKTAKECAIAFLSIIQDVYSLTIKLVHTDNGGEFKGAFRAQLEAYNIKHIKGRPYNPKCQGSVEAFNNTIQNKIKIYRNDCNTNGVTFKLEKAIKESLNYYNNQHKHTTTQQVPNRLFYAESSDEMHTQVQANVNKLAIKKELQNVNINVADFVFIENKYLNKDEILIHKDDKKSKEVIATGIVISIENSSFCRILITESKDTLIYEKDIITIDNCCLLKCKEIDYNTQRKILKNL